MSEDLLEPSLMMVIAKLTIIIDTANINNYVALVKHLWVTAPDYAYIYLFSKKISIIFLRVDELAFL